MPDDGTKEGRSMGLEPTTPGITIRCSNQLSYDRHITIVKRNTTVLQNTTFRQYIRY